MHRGSQETVASSLTTARAVFAPRPGRLLTLQVAAMVFLAALAGAGCLAATSLASRWREAADGAIVQVAETDAAAVAALLGPAWHRLSQAEMEAALKPFLGEDASRPALPLPVVFTLPGNPPPGLAQALARTAPGALVSRGAAWQQRAASVADSLRGCATLAAGAMALLAAAMVAAATCAALSASQEAAHIVHHLGATDGQIAGELAAGAFVRALAGAAVGSFAVVPVLLALARLTAPLQPLSPGATAASLPFATWPLLAAVSLLAALIAWATAQAKARAWLRLLP